MDDLTPLSAPAAPDPYPYYARLVAERPFYRDDDLNLWVASSAQAVEAVLRSEALRVRPPREPIPAAIRGTSAGTLYGRFARMTDGAYHAHVKSAVVAAFDSFASTDLSLWARRCAENFPQQTVEPVMRLFPAFAIAAALGFSAEHAVHVADACAQLARSLDCAAADLLTAGVGTLLENRSARGPLLEAFVSSARREGVPADAVAANAIGLLFQSCDATGGLIGNTLLALRSNREDTLPDLVKHVVRYDPPVHNTRRYSAAEIVLLDNRVRADETILVLLAAANHDPVSRRSYTFGMGAHACPGERVACAIAVAAVSRLMQRGELQTLRFTGYRPALNVRIPEFE